MKSKCEVDYCDRPIYGKQPWCSKHYQHIKMFGYIKRTKFDPNEFIIEKDICRIKLYDSFGKENNEAIIDVDDYEKCKQHKWCKHGSGCVCSMIKSKIVFLHHFVLGIINIGNKEIAHTDGNKYDNRKNKLKITDKFDNINRKHTEETKNKMSKTRIGKPCPWVTEALTGRERPDIKGKKLSEERKAKLRGRIPWNKNKKMDEEWCKRSSEINSGPNSPWWKGGVWFYNTKDAKIRTEKKRLERKKLNGGSYTKQEWLELKEYCEFTCLSCGKREPEIELTVDHIVPISQGGSGNIENIQPLCRNCNSKKGTKIINHIEKYKEDYHGQRCIYT